MNIKSLVSKWFNITPKSRDIVVNACWGCCYDMEGLNSEYNNVCDLWLWTCPECGLKQPDESQER